MIFAADFVEPHANYLRVFTRTDGLLEARAELERGIYVGEIDGCAITSDEALFAAVQEAFHFPDHFGRNWDALFDCLCDFDWLPRVGYLAVVQHAARPFGSGEPMAALST